MGVSREELMRKNKLDGEASAINHIQEEESFLAGDVLGLVVKEFLCDHSVLISCSRRLREAGWSNRRIGRHLGRSDMVWQHGSQKVVYRRGGSGRPRNTNDDRAIRRVATSAPTIY
ncbi:hypothetical protein TNCV_1274661 [Trichonephila clavipes]|nr:hypothetical protein TNCV_1274661 [Trichonephila clavipes]